MNNLTKPKIGISQCLLGDSVRYNGGHKLDHYIKNVVGKFVELIPICPEVEAGLGIPREAIQLTEKNEQIRVIGINSKTDFTEKIEDWIKQKSAELEQMNLVGFIFKSKSPSCGVYRTRLYRENKPPSLNSRGLFAKYIMEKFPKLIIEEEGRLHDPIIRENFISKIFIELRWREMTLNKSVSRLIKFHESMKYTLMSHSPTAQKELGQIVASIKKNSLDKEMELYYLKLVETLNIHVDKKRVRNVLDHIMGYFKLNITHDEKIELKGLIKNYSTGLVPLIVPITLINHYVNKYNEPYLKDQFFLNPHPLELMLRNHI